MVGVSNGRKASSSASLSGASGKIPSLVRIVRRATVSPIVVSLASGAGAPPDRVAKPASGLYNGRRGTSEEAIDDHGFRTVVTLGLTGALGMPVSAGALAQTQLKASHQWPGGKGDVRDEMVQIIAREVAAADVGLDIRIYPAASLFKPTQQWDAMVQGQLDISAFPLDYASGKHPQFSATLMPGLVKNHEHAKRLNDSAFMEDIKQIIDEQGVMVLSDAWLAGGFASKGECVLEPADAQGKVMRAAGPAFEQMLAAAGASINSMPSSEIYTGLQTGVLDAVNTSSGSFVSYRIYEQVDCLTPPGDLRSGSCTSRS